MEARKEIMHNTITDTDKVPEDGSCPGISGKEIFPDRPLKILLFGDHSNYNRCLAEGLRRSGHHVLVASNGTFWMDTERDFDLARRYRGKLGGLDLWWRIKRAFKGTFSGFDIVSVNGSCYAELKPVRLQKIFDYLSGHNANIFVSVLGSDSHYVDTCAGDNSPLRYSEWQINGKPSPLAIANADEIERWRAPEIYNLCRNIYHNTRGAMAALYEYHEVCRSIVPEAKLGYGGIPIDTKAIEYSGVDPTGRKVKLFLGRHASRQIEKGTDRLYTAANRVADNHPDKCQLDVIENIPYAEYVKRLRNSDIVLDQLYSYTPATNALLAMAMGKTVVSGGEPEYYDFIGEHDNRPIINAVPDDDEALYKSIERAVLNPQFLIDNAPRNRDFVLKHNDTDIVARRYLDFWLSHI